MEKLNRYICMDCKCSFTKLEKIKLHCGQQKHGWADTKPKLVAKQGRFLAGSIGVDSGTVMIADPCYLIGKNNLTDDHGWDNVCNQLSESNHNPIGFTLRGFGGGIISPTHHGDGEYPVYITFDADGRPTKMEVIFSRNTTQKDQDKFIEYNYVVSEDIQKRMNEIS